MKKIIILITSLFLITGCNKECEVCYSDIKYTKEELENQLIVYGKYMYESDYWINKASKGTYYMTIKEMYEVNKYDITMFMDYNCKLDTTKIEFIVKSEYPNFDYEYNAVLDCEF